MPIPKNAALPITAKFLPQPLHYVENLDTRPFHATRIPVAGLRSSHQSEIAPEIFQALGAAEKRREIRRVDENDVSSRGAREYLYLPHTLGEELIC